MSDATREPGSVGKSGVSRFLDGPPGRPQTVVVSAALILAAGVAAVAAGLSLHGQDNWLLAQLTKSNAKLAKNKQLSHSQLLDRVASTEKSVLIMGFLTLLILAIVASAVYRGRYWSRWVAVGIVVVATIEQLPCGLLSLLAVTGDVPGAYKATSVLSALFLLGGVFAVNMRPSLAYLALTRPPRPAGAPVRRGLFSPRPPAAPRGATVAATGPARTPDQVQAAVDRSRAKKRTSLANADAVAKGADMARARARASKSRRTDR